MGPREVGKVDFGLTHRSPRRRRVPLVGALVFAAVVQFVDPPNCPYRELLALMMF